MLIAVWAVALLLLLLWTATLWAAHVGWQMLATLPWSQVAERLQQVQLSPLLDLWLGAAWREWIAAVEPLVAWGLQLLQGSGSWLEGLMPVVLLATWAVGTLALLGVAAGAAVLVTWARRRRRRHPIQAA